MRCLCVRHRVCAPHLFRPMVPRLLLLVASVLLLPTSTSLAAPTIRIVGPSSARVGSEAVLRAEALNDSAKDILDTGGFFEWWIDGKPRTTGLVFRCRSSEMAEYVIELQLKQPIGARTVTFATDRFTLSFVATSSRAALQPTTVKFDPSMPRVSPGAAHWVLRSQKDYFETNRADGATQRLELRRNESIGISTRREEGSVEARVRWPTFPSTLTPGHQLVFDMQHELRLTPALSPDGRISPVSAVSHARFFVLSEYKHERFVDSLSGSADTDVNRLSKTKRIQWVIPGGRVGDTVSLEVGCQSPAGIVSRIYEYRLEMPLTTDQQAVPSLQVGLSAERTNVPVGASTLVKVHVTGGAAPVRYQWTEDGLIRPESGDALTVKITQTGVVRIAVLVTDARNRTAGSQIVLEGTAPSVRLRKESPAGYSVFVGEPVVLRAEIVGSTPIADSQLAFHWLGSETTFFDAIETATPTNRARSYVIGLATALVELVYRPSPASVQRLARSEPLTFAASAPTVWIAFDPPAPFVGQEIRAIVQTDPPVGGVECRWMEMPSNVVILARSADARELQFMLRDSQPAVFNATLVLPRLQTLVAEGSGRIVAQRYLVNITGPSGEEPRPRVWREGVGAVTLESEFAAGQPLRFTANLLPSGAVQHWTWSTSSRGCQIHPEPPSSAKVICSHTGRFEIVARAYGARDIELAAARKVFSVTVSSQDLATAQRRIEAQALREKGYNLLQVGALREAIAAYRQSYKLWPTEELQRHIEQLEREAHSHTATAEQAAALRREEEKRRTEADKLKETAWEHIRARRYDEGLEAFRRSLALKPDAELEAQVRQLRDAVDKRRARQAEAARLRRDGETYEAAGQLKEALASYRASLAAWQDDTVELRAHQIEQKLVEQEKRAARAMELISEGEQLEQEGDWSGAIKAYEQSLQLQVHAEILARVARLQERQRQQAANRATAQRLSKEANALIQKGAMEEALLKFRESLRLWPDDTVAQQARALEARLEQDQQTREKAAQLRDEAAALAVAGKPEEALSKYRESVALWANPELDQRIKDLEAEISRQKALREEADRLAAQAARLESEQKLNEALAVYRQLLQRRADPDVAAHITQLEERLRQQIADRAAAQKVAADADALAEKGELDNAVLKYRESLRLWPDETVAERAQNTEAKLAQQLKKRDQAVKLREEAASLVLAGRLDAALAKYRESAALWPNPEVNQRIQDLQAELARRQAIQAKAQKLAAEGASLEANQRWDEAIEAYRKSLALAPDEDLAQKVKHLEARKTEEGRRRLEAALLREQAAAAVAAGKLEKALDLYQQSLALERHPAAEQQAAALEKQIHTRKAALEKAAHLYKEGVALEQEERWEEAAAKYRECVILADHTDARKRLTFVQRTLERRAVEKEKAAEAAKVKEITARKLREEGWALQQKGQLAEAATQFRASLDLVPDPELEQLLRDLEKTIADAKEKDAQAKLLREEGRQLAIAGRYDAAIKKYEQSLALRPDPAVEEALSRVRKQHQKKQDDLRRAAELRLKASEMEKAGNLAEAASLYRESLLYSSDAETRIRAARLEARAREQVIAQKAADAALEARKASAQRLWEEAEDLRSKGFAEDALLKMRASLEIWEDGELKARMTALQEEIARQKELLQKAKSLEAEAAAHEQMERWEEALAKYRESFQIYSNAVVQQHIARLEQQVHAKEQQRAEAARWAAQGDEHMVATRYDEAIAAFQKSLSLRKDATIEMKLAATEQLREEKLAQRRRLEQQAVAEAQHAQSLEKKGDWDSALAAYERSLALHVTPDVQHAVDSLRQKIADRNRRRMEAMRLRDEANVLAQQDKLEEALAKYRESMALWPDKKLEKQMLQLEDRIRRLQEDRELALRLRKEATAMERDGLKEEALAKYRESMRLHSRPDVEAAISKLQIEIEREQASRESAARLWQDGMLRFRSGKRTEGLVLLRQSIQMLPDPRRAEALRQMESWVTTTPAAPAVRKATPAPTVAAPTSVPATLATEKTAGVPQLRSGDNLARTHWKGVVLFKLGDDSFQWPLRIRVGEAYDISGSFDQRDLQTGRIIQYSVSGVADPTKKIWYMACLRNDGQITHKATLSGQTDSDETAGGTASILLGGTVGREPIKGLWRLLRQP